jgi:hypothetical protein
MADGEIWEVGSTQAAAGVGSQNLFAMVPMVTLVTIDIIVQSAPMFAWVTIVSMATHGYIDKIGCCVYG